MKRILAALMLVMLAGAYSAFAQSTRGEKTVEESYLQESLEVMIIREQAFAESKDLKMLALQYIGQAITEGRPNPEIRKALEFLATESTSTIIRSGGTGRILNNFPDVRREASLLLGSFPSEEAKDTLLKVAMTDNEPMVIAAAIKSLGKIAINTNEEVSRSIAAVVNRFDVLHPDNMLAFESILAFEAIAEADNGIRDQSAIRAIMRIADGNYITPVRNRAKELLSTLRMYSANAGGK
jgi:hypothetical protein